MIFIDSLFAKKELGGAALNLLNSIAIGRWFYDYFCLR